MSNPNRDANADLQARNEPQVHPTAIVEPGTEIGDGTKVWHFSHVMDGARIGPDCIVGKYVEIGPNVRIGRGCKIQNNVSVYKGVTLEDYVFCGPSMVFTNISNPRAAIRKMDQIRPTLVKRHATLGANCTIVCGTIIGEFALVGAGTVVTKDVPGHALVVGNPCRQIGWVSQHGERLDLPVQGQGQAKCPVTGELYQLVENTLVRIQGARLNRDGQDRQDGQDIMRNVV